MFYDYKDSAFETLDSAVASALSKEAAAATQYDQYVNVKMGTWIGDTGKVAVPANFLTNEEIDAADSADEALWLVHNKFTGTSVRYQQVSEMTDAISSAFNNYKSAVETRTIRDGFYNHFSFEADHHDSAMTEAKAAIIQMGQVRKNQTDSVWADIQQQVIDGTLTTEDSDYVRYNTFRNAMDNIGVHEDFPNITVADIPDPYKYSKGLNRFIYDIYHEDLLDNINGRVFDSDDIASNIPSSITLNGQSRTELYSGYFKADSSGDYTFALRSDDGGYLWVHEDAVRYHEGNCTSKHPYETGITDESNAEDGTVRLKAGNYHRFKCIIGMNYDNDNGTDVTLTITTPSGNTITDASKYFYTNTDPSTIL